MYFNCYCTKNTLARYLRTFFCVCINFIKVITTKKQIKPGNIYELTLSEESYKTTVISNTTI